MVGKRTLPAAGPGSAEVATSVKGPTPGKTTLVQQLADPGAGAGGDTAGHERVQAAAAHGISAPAGVRFARGFNVSGSALSGVIMRGGGYGAIESTPMARVERAASWFADHFMAWVNAGLAAEGTH